MPREISGYLSQDLFTLMRKYKLHKSKLTVIHTLIVVMFCGVIELYLGFYGFLWRFASKVAYFRWMKHEVIVSVIFVLLLNFYLTLKSLPIHIYEKYCIPTLFKQTDPPSLASRLLRFLFETLGTVISLVVMVVILYFVITGMGSYAFLGLFLVSLLFSLFFILIVPILIDPFMGKTVELENASLKAQLDQLTASVGFPKDRVFIIRVRDVSMGSNAFFYGTLCLKRIVIFDTLLQNRGLNDPSQLPPAERNKGLPDAYVVAVVAHELGHWHYCHFCKTLFAFKLHILLTLLFFCLSMKYGPIFEAVGFEKGLTPVIPGFIIIFGFLLTPYFTISNVLMLSMTRYFEYQADKFAYKLGYSSELRQALVKLYADNLSFPISDELYSMWNHTHPTMLHRLKRLQDLDRNQN